MTGVFAVRQPSIFTHKGGGVGTFFAKNLLLRMWKYIYDAIKLVFASDLYCTRSWNKNKKIRLRFFAVVEVGFIPPPPPPSAYKEIIATSLSFLLVFLLSVWKVEGGEGWNRFNRRQKSVIFLTYYCSTNREEKLRIKEV
jgi:hypothetical protein